jgi:hypothetical protein
LVFLLGSYAIIRKTLPAHRDGRGEAAHKTFISLLLPHLEEKLISDSSMFDDDEILTAETIILADKANFHFCAGTRIRRHRQRHILSGLVSGLLHMHNKHHAATGTTSCSTTLNHCTLLDFEQERPALLLLAREGIRVHHFFYFYV